MLHQLSSLNKEGYTWVVFNAWKFPERNNLWEGFVLELVKSIQPNFFQTIRKKIDGENKNDVKSLIKVLFQGANIFLPGAAIGENLSKLFHSSPAKRAFEFQEILQEFLNKQVKSKTLVVVIEDIDRSGDKGVYFLETLKEFLRSSDLNKKVICVVPMSKKSFQENQDSYDKCIDYIHHFEPKSINFTNFINKIFNAEHFPDTPHWVGQLNYFCKGFISNNGNTIRRLKNFLRNANIKYLSLPEEIKDEIDARVFLAIMAVRYFGGELSQPLQYNRHAFINSHGWINGYLILVANKVDDPAGYEMNIPIQFVNNNKLKIPNFARDMFERGEQDSRKYFLSDIYLRLD